MPDNDPLSPGAGGGSGKVPTGDIPAGKKISAKRILFLLAGTAAACVFPFAATGIAGLAFALRAKSELREFARAAASRFEASFNMRPEIRADGVIIVEGTKPVLEIATARRDLLARYRWKNTFLYSTKEFEIEAPFRAAAGFRFPVPLRIDLDPWTRGFKPSLPPPEILSLEMGDPKILRDEDGIWNKLTAEDREAAFRELRKQAELQAREPDLLAEATRQAEARIAEVMGGPAPAQTPPP